MIASLDDYLFGVELKIAVSQYEQMHDVSLLDEAIQAQQQMMWLCQNDDSNKIYKHRKLELFGNLGT